MAESLKESLLKTLSDIKPKEESLIIRIGWSIRNSFRKGFRKNPERLSKKSMYESLEELLSQALSDIKAKEEYVASIKAQLKELKTLSDIKAREEYLASIDARLKRLKND